MRQPISWPTRFSRHIKQTGLIRSPPVLTALSTYILCLQHCAVPEMSPTFHSFFIVLISAIFCHHLVLSIPQQLLVTRVYLTITLTRINHAIFGFSLLMGFAVYRVLKVRSMMEAAMGIKSMEGKRQCRTNSLGWPTLNHTWPGATKP